MNEQTQLDAIRLELISEGYVVDQDVAGETVGEDEAVLESLMGMKLDLVARLTRQGNDQQPKLLIVEVANRTRLIPHKRGGIRLRLKRVLENDHALARFEAITSALENRLDAALQVRFFDVSADQSNARRLTKTRVRAKKAMVERLLQDHKWLVLGSQEKGATHALIVARLWSYWARIMANLFPGHEHKELRYADLRTVQKDLSDYKIVAMSSSHYHRVHGEILSIMEGGDFDPNTILELEADLRSLFAAAAARYGIELGQWQPDPGEAYSRALEDLTRRSSEVAFRPAVDALQALSLVRGTPRFPIDLASFLLIPNVRTVLSSETLNSLLREAATMDE